MIGDRLSWYVHRLAQRLGPAEATHSDAGPRYTKLPPFFEISAELVALIPGVIDGRPVFPSRPRLFIFWGQSARHSLYACPLTLPGLALFIYVALIRALEVIEALAFLACAMVLGVKPERRMTAISWGWIFGEDFHSFHWRCARYAIGDWSVQVFPR